MKIKAKQIQK